jgi:hypothetical protein
MRQLIIIALFFCGSLAMAQAPKGAWKSQEPTGSTSTLIVADNYLTIASYSVLNKYYERTEGGPFSMQGNQMTYTPEFNPSDTAKVGIPIVFTVTKKDGVLTLKYEEAMVWMKIDESENAPLAGAWRITERANEGQGDLVKIHQEGTRKTLKILSGTRFQWIAFDTAEKTFYNTGGGTYTIKNGKYSERIEFFSKDNNRVGNTVTFDYKLDNGRWDHKGMSTAGKPVHEIWEKIQ